jgi:hypothetical protein
VTALRSAIPKLTPWRAWLLALLLLAAQAAGLAHRIAHASPAGGATAQSVWKADHEAGSADCLLVDQLCHADALSSGVLPALPTLRPGSSAMVLAAEAVRAGPAPEHLARGPPRA